MTAEENPEIVIPHQFRPGMIRELMRNTYKSPKSAYKEMVSNALDEQGRDARVDIFIPPAPECHGNIICEDYGPLGIQDEVRFTYVGAGEKRVGDRVSSYKQVDEDMIGEKGLGKLSFINLSSTGVVEFYSHGATVGVKITMTEKGFTKPISMDRALIGLGHPGVRVVIKNAKKEPGMLSADALMKYLSKIFAIRIARGAQIRVNGNLVTKPEGFDSNEGREPQFLLADGTGIKGHLSVPEKASGNIDVFVKKVFAETIPTEYQVEGWVNFDRLELTSSRDGIHEEGAEYEMFRQALDKHLYETYQKKTEKREHIQAAKAVVKMFGKAVCNMYNLFPHLTKPFMAGIPSEPLGPGMSTTSNTNTHPYTEQEVTIVNNTTTDGGQQRYGTPIGGGKKGPRGPNPNNPSQVNTTPAGEKQKILAPQYLMPAEDGKIPEFELVHGKNETRPFVYFAPPNRLVVNECWMASEIIGKASEKRKSDFNARVLPLIISAVVDAAPGASEMSHKEWAEIYNQTLEASWKEIGNDSTE